jgi:hypothetical protein
MVPSSQEKPSGTRALIDISIHLCTTSCGYSVPIYKYVKEREILKEWAENMENSTDLQAMERKYKREVPAENLFLGTNVEGRPASRWLEAYWIMANALSIDGLPGLRISRDFASAEEKERLLKKKELADRLEGPVDDAGPFKSSSIAAPPPTPVDTANSTAIALKSDVFNLTVAFTLGCALTTSLFLAPRLLPL